MLNDPGATPGTGTADDALDRLWAVFFGIRAAAADGRLDPASALIELRALHRRAGDTGSAHVPVFRAEIRGELTLIKSGVGRLGPGHRPSRSPGDGRASR